MADFKTDWARFYSGRRPTGYWLRQSGARHWVRFHALAESKRYATIAAERKIVFERLNELAERVFRDGRNCWLVQTCWRGDNPINPATTRGTDPFRACEEYRLSLAFVFPNEDEGEWHVHAAVVEWKRGAFDDLLADIANDRAAPTLWMSLTDGAVFAPYDGGVDLFLPDATDTDRLRATFPSWLSQHPEGL